MRGPTRYGFPDVETGEGGTAMFKYSLAEKFP